MGLAAEKKKATWLRVSAGNGGSGFLQYRTGNKNHEGKAIYADVEGGLENVYLDSVKYKVDENPEGKKTKKLYATFSDAYTDDLFMITCGWKTQLARSIVYDCYHDPRFDPAKPLTVIKTFMGKDPLPNGFKPIVALLSQVPNPQKGDYLSALSKDIKEGRIQKTIPQQSDDGSSYMTIDYAGILNPLVDALNEKLRPAREAREQAKAPTPVATFEPEDDYDDYEGDGYVATVPSPPPAAPQDYASQFGTPVQLPSPPAPAPTPAATSVVAPPPVAPPPAAPQAINQFSLLKAAITKAAKAMDWSTTAGGFPGWLRLSAGVDTVSAIPDNRVQEIADALGCAPAPELEAVDDGLDGIPF